MLLDRGSHVSTDAPLAGAPKPSLTRIVDWVALGTVALLVTALAVRASGPVGDPDTWWHLRLGEEFRGPWSLAHPGHLSPFATRPWFATQWTLEVVASYLEQAFGLAAVSWLAGVGVVALSVAVYASCRQRGSVLPAALASTLVLFATALSHGPRPQLASFIFTAVYITAWFRTSEDLRPRWWLAPLTWLWACTHGMWFVGVLIGVAVVLGLLMERRLGRKAAVRLGSVPLACLAAAAVTPVGPRLILAPLATSKMAWFITEWQPPKFSEPIPALAAVVVAAIVMTWSRSGSRRSWTEILLLAMAAGWIALYYRTIAVGAVIAAPLLAGAIQSWVKAQRVQVQRWEPLAVAAGSLAIVLGLAIAAPARGPAPLEEMGRMNTALGRLPDGTVVFNEYELGGWLEWRHRNVAPVVDGMTDGYQVHYVASYVNATELEPGWQRFVGRTHAHYALLAVGTPLVAGLVQSMHWRVEVRQSKYVLLRASNT